jgi:hypothetical protein
LIPVQLWQAIEARDWSRVRSLLHDDFTIEWPQSGERYGPDVFVRINREYPGNWTLKVERVVDAGEWVVTEVAVAIDGRTDRAVSFFEVEDARIKSIREFWPEPFPVPEWRKAFGTT